MNAATVRVALASDAEVAIEVVRRSIVELCVADHKGDPESLADWLGNKTADRFVEWISRPGQYTVVAERRGVLCGVGMLGADGTVRLCYVHPQHARRGVGKALVAAMQRHAQARGVGRLALNSTRSAVAFYEAMGFRRCDRPTGETAASDDNFYEKLIGMEGADT